MIRRAAALGLCLAIAAAGCARKQKVPEPVTAEEPKEERPDEPAEKGVKPRGDRPRVPASPEALLATGAVTRIQRALVDRGYLTQEHEPGELDTPTSAAIRELQEDEGLAATGMPDRETLRRLGIDPQAAYGREKAE